MRKTLVDFTGRTTGVVVYDMDYRKKPHGFACDWSDALGFPVSKEDGSLKDAGEDITGLLKPSEKTDARVLTVAMELAQEEKPGTVPVITSVWYAIYYESAVFYAFTFEGWD